jgi:hypothetical protein
MGLESSARDETIQAPESQIVPIQRQSDQIVPQQEGATPQDFLPLHVRQELRRRDDELRDTIQDLQMVLTSLLLQTGLDVKNHLAYRSLIRQIRHVVRAVVNPDATVIVVSKGDDELLKLGGSCAWHFPQRADGKYAGFYPADSSAAIAHLEELRGKGAAFLLFPKTSFWWLEHYASFKWHLERTCRLIHRSDDTCWIFALRQPSPWKPLADLIVDWKTRHRSYPAILNWETGVELGKIFPECAVFDTAEPGRDKLPYLERSIPVVAVAYGDPLRLEEARRVASEAAVMLVPTADGQSGRLVTIEKPSNEVVDEWPEPRVVRAITQQRQPRRVTDPRSSAESRMLP